MRALTGTRFPVVVLVANAVVVPPVAIGLSRWVADDRGLLVGVLLVLLTPCIDYVVVFTGLAGGARAQMLAATPLLMVAQMLLLPGYLWLAAGPEVLAVVEAGPFLHAFLVLVLAPLAAAALVQGLRRRRPTGRAARVEGAVAGAMVPLMAATLTAVVGSQIAAVGAQALTLVRLVPLYLAFVVAAVVFSVTTRNSLVVLPLALALPGALALAPLAVVTQTLVELVALVVLVRLVPVLVPAR